MRVKPLYDRVVVRKLTEEVTAGGIIIPENAQDGETFKAVVLAVGDGYRGDDGLFHPLKVSDGDIVLLSKWGGSRIDFDGHEAIIVRESDILAIVEESSIN